MNLRDKLRAIDSKPSQSGSPVRTQTFTDCLHLPTFLPPEQFPGAFSLDRETLLMMQPDEFPETLDPRRILYLDTETTGLGGSGTVAFLVGTGFLTDHGFEVHQFMIRDYPEEQYLLKHIAGGLNKFDMLCTFNGKTFDIPLLESRFLMNRMDPSPLRIPHIDLLQLARRLWRLRLGKCNLGRLEEVILGKPRTDDLPGSEVPQRFFNYLKTGQLCLLDDVLKHNVQDIASLCVLLNHMADLYLHPEKIAFPEDVYSMGRALERNSCTVQARRCYRLALRGKMGSQASTALAHSYRRSGDLQEAAVIWKQMIASGRGGITPYIEMAKYCEHRLRDIPTAMEYTRKAMSLLAEPSLKDGSSVQSLQNELQYRYARLKRKASQKET